MMSSLLHPVFVLFSELTSVQQFFQLDKTKSCLIDSLVRRALSSSVISGCRVGILCFEYFVLEPPLWPLKLFTC